MATREVKVGLRADVNPYIAGIRAAERATTRFADRAVADAARAQNALGGVGPAGGPTPRGGGPAGPAPGSSSQAAAAAAAQTQQWEKQAEAMNTVGTAATGMGVAINAGLLMSAKAAIDWESAWAGVTKTVDGSAEEMAALEGQLRGMAKTLPASHAEIAGVAEAAGQLGVKRQDIAAFTKTMIDLGVSTNLSAEDASTAIAQMTNVMGTAPEDVDRLGSALVALGNAGASTERDIMNMASRLTGAGKLVGASEAGVLAMANAMSSVGIEAELGGGAMSRALQKMYTSVKTGGPILESFAKTAGMSADAFAEAFRDDPMRAVSSFVSGLARIKDAGGNVVAALGDVKIKGTQDLQVLLRLAGASDVLTQSLDLGDKAWQQNTALTDEASKRYATVASKLKVARNAVYDLAIQMGMVLLPFVEKAADAVTKAIDVLGNMPAPLREIVVGLTAVGAATLLFGGALLLTVPRIVATRTALQTLAATAMWTRITTNFALMQGAAAALMATAAGPWVAAFVAAAAAVGGLLLWTRKGKPPIDDLTAAIKANGQALNEANRAAMADRLAKEGLLTLADKYRYGLRDLEGALKDTSGAHQQYGIDLADVTAAAMGNVEAQDRLNAAIDGMRGPLEAEMARLREVQATATDSNTAMRASFDMKNLAQGALADLDRLSQGVNANSDAWSRASREADQHARASAEVESQAKRTADAVEEQLNRAIGNAHAAARRAAGGTNELSTGIGSLGQMSADTEKKIKDLNAEIDDLFSAAFDVPRAVDAFHKGLNDLITQVQSAAEAGNKGARSLTGYSNAAIANRESVYRLADSIGDVTQKMLEAGEPADSVAAKVATMRSQLLKAAGAAGLNRDEVANLIGVLDDLPATVRTYLDVESADAQSAVGRVAEMIAEIPKDVVIRFSSTGNVRSPGGGQYQVGGPTMADGGYVSGPGGPREDRIAAWLSNGEFVVNASATARHRPLLEHVNAGRYADGGPVGGHGWVMPRNLKGVEDALKKLGDRLDKLNATLKEDKLGQIQKERRQFAADIKAGYLAAADVTSLPNFGGSGQLMMADLQRQLDRANAFTDVMARLRKAGLNETTLEQLRAGGTERGLDAATQLLNGGDIKAINRLVWQIGRAGSKLGKREATVEYGDAEAEARKDKRDELAERRRLIRRRAALNRRLRELEKARDDDPSPRPVGASRRTPTGRTLSAVSSGGSLAPVHVKVTFDVTGADREMKALIRRIVREDGHGSVQKAFG